MEEKRPPGSEIKSKNRTNIYQLLRKNPGLSRQDICQALQLSRPTVHQNLTELQGEGLIAPSGSISSTGGRRARSFDIVSNARTAIGLDISRSQVCAVVVDLRGKVIHRCRRKLDFQRSDSYYRALGDMVDEAAWAAGRERVLGVGIGVPGLLTPDRQQVFYGATMNFTGATSQEFSRYITYPTTLIHDVAAACAAETWNNPHINNALYLMLNNTIGGAVYINGQPYLGEQARSGELGHMTIVPGGKLCYCGKRGCVDAYCAASVLSSESGGDLREFFRRLDGGDEAARALWATYVRHLAIAVHNLRMLFDCQVILGGYLGEQMGSHHLQELREHLAGLNPFEASGDYLQPSAGQTEEVAAGAALHYISEFIHSV